jgi:hypothetical protein
LNKIETNYLNDRAPLVAASANFSLPEICMNAIFVLAGGATPFQASGFVQRVCRCARRKMSESRRSARRRNLNICNMLRQRRQGRRCAARCEERAVGKSVPNFGVVKSAQS